MFLKLIEEFLSTWEVVCSLEQCRRTRYRLRRFVDIIRQQVGICGLRFTQLLYLFFNNVFYPVVK